VRPHALPFAAIFPAWRTNPTLCRSKNSSIPRREIRSDEDLFHGGAGEGAHHLGYSGLERGAAFITAVASNSLRVGAGLRRISAVIAVIRSM